MSDTAADFRLADEMGGEAIELLRITPSHKLIFVGGAGEDTGCLSWENGRLSFNGNIEESAKAFFEFLKPYVDEYITRNNGCLDSLGSLVR